MSTTTATDTIADAPARRVPGVEGIWVLIAGDMVIFAMLFGSFMHARSANVGAFEDARHALDFHHGGLNTLLLVTSSWCVVRALGSMRSARRGVAVRWLGLGIVGG